MEDLLHHLVPGTKVMSEKLSAQGSLLAIVGSVSIDLFELECKGVCLYMFLILQRYWRTHWHDVLTCYAFTLLQTTLAQNLQQSRMCGMGINGKMRRQHSTFFPRRRLLTLTNPQALWKVPMGYAARSCRIWYIRKLHFVVSTRSLTKNEQETWCVSRQMN